MECNKEEAEKCKAISEASLKKFDLAAARRFALKAKQLFPELEGLAQLLSILDVTTAANEKLQTGEANWYAILQVDFRADENTIRKQYRKLALFLHPDKNKSFGAEAAFKQISQAWSVLSDGKKKSDYDKKWYAHMALQRARALRPSQNSPAFQARGNIRKQHIHGVQQVRQGPFLNQFKRQAQPGQFQVHCQQGQGQSQVQVRALKQQVQDKVHAELQEKQGHIQAHKQQGQAHQQEGNGQGPTHQPKGQSQVHAHAHQDKGQSQKQTHHSQQQIWSQKCGQGPTPFYKKEQQGEGLPQQQGQGEGHAGQCEDQGEVHVGQCKDQGEVHVQEQGQCQTPGDQQHQKGQAHALTKGQSQVHNNQQQGQGQAHVEEQGKAQAQLQKEQKGKGPHQQQQGQGYIQGQVQCQAHVEEQDKGQEQLQQEQKGKGPHYQQQGQGYIQQKTLQLDTHCREHNEALMSKLDISQDKSTFWTACSSCKMQLEYGRVYMNKKLCCPMCFRPFVSKEIEPRKGVLLWPWPMLQHNEEASELEAGNNSCTVDHHDSIHLANSNVHKNMTARRVQKDNIPAALERTACEGNTDRKANVPDNHKLRARNRNLAGLKENGGPSANMKNSPASPTAVVQGSPGAVKEKVDVGIIEGMKKVADERDLRRKIRNVTGPKENGSLPSNMNSSAATDQAPASRRFVQNVPAPTEKNAYVGNIKVEANDLEECNSRVRTRNSSRNEKVEVGGSCITMGIAAADQSYPSVRTRHSAEFKEIRGLRKSSDMSELGNESSQKKRKLIASTVASLDEDSGTLKRAKQIANQVQLLSNSAKENGSHQLLKDSKISDSSFVQVDVFDDLGKECEMEVPDSDFYNFDEDRTEKHFAEGQYWATYDDDDGMPRYYARINKILSLQPLKMQMNWLEARDCTDETLAWLDAGFQQSCGDFKLGSVYMADQVSTFSHLMTVEKALKGGYKIYPRHGDVWAIYKDWELLKVSDDKRGYDMVEIITTFDGRKGVQVARLCKVAGFKTVFERKIGEGYIKWIPFHEIKRFSHQVPTHPVVAGTVAGIQVDCLELDPASTPMNLIIGDQ